MKNLENEQPNKREEYLAEAKEILTDYAFSLNSEYTIDGIVKMILHRNDPEFKEAFMERVVEAIDSRRKVENQVKDTTVQPDQSIIHSDQATRGFERLNMLRERLKKIII